MGSRRLAVSSKPKTRVGKVKLYPVPGAYIPGVPAQECEVSAKEAERLLAYTPPAFTTKAPGRAVAAAKAPPRKASPPRRAAPTTNEGPAPAGPSASQGG